MKTLLLLVALVGSTYATSKLLYYSHTHWWDVCRYQPADHWAEWLSVGDSPPYGRLSCRLTVHLRKYKWYSFSCSVRYWKILHMFKEYGVRLKVHTLFLGRVLYFPIPHSNEHRLHIITNPLLAPRITIISFFICYIFPWRLKRFFQFEIIINVLFSSFRLIWIHMLCVYGHCKYFNTFSAGIVVKRQNLISADVRLWRIKTVPTLKGLSAVLGNTPSY